MTRVIVLGPVPDSAGGIGVLMGHLSRARDPRTTLRFVDSGASPAPRAVRVARFLRALGVCAGPVPRGTVFHVNLSSQGSTWRKVLLTRLLSWRGHPYVLHLHGGQYREFFSGAHPALRRVIRHMFHRAATVIVLGQYWRRTVAELMDLDPAEITVVPNAVPGPHEVPDRGAEPTVLFSGRVGLRKGGRDLLRAWALLPDEIRTTLVLAGDDSGELGELLESTPDIRVTGWLGPTELEEQLRRASVLVLPSHAENLPMSLLDGMAWGLVPVVTDVGAVGEVVQNERSAVVVPVGDPRMLATALEELLTSPSRIARMGAEARQRWEAKYRIEDYCARLEDVYEQVAGAGA